MPPVLTEPKKLSMPQQVQKNKEDIESIFKKIDGLDAIDNVVVVPDISYILTADELKSVRQPVAFIVYNNNVYLKRKEESNTAYFDRVFSIALSTVITFNSEEIVVDLTNGALGINSTSVNTYSVSQIDSKFPTALYVDNALAQKASLGGANFTGAITAPSIIEVMNGYTMSLIPVENLTMEAVYGGAVKNGNKLTIGLAVNLTKTDNLSGSKQIMNLNIPADVANKLFQTDIGSYRALDLKKVSGIYGSSSIVDLNILVEKGTNAIRFYLQGDTVNSLPLNQKTFVRIEATYLLSNSLI